MTSNVKSILTDNIKFNWRDVNAAIVNKSVEIMSIDKKSCLFCLEVTNDGIEIFGQTGKTLNVWEVIVKYFWFDVI